MVKRQRREKAEATAATPEVLLEAATALMAERKSPEISLADVGERTGLSRALILYHFGSKEGMLLAVLDRGVAPETAKLKELARADLSATVKLRMHIAGLLRTYLAKPYANRLLHLLMAPDDPARAQRVFDIYVRPMSSFYQALIEQGVAEGVFQPVDPRLFYFMLVGATEQFTSSGTVMMDLFGEPGITDTVSRRYEEFLYRTALGVLAPGDPIRP